MEYHAIYTYFGPSVELMGGIFVFFRLFHTHSLYVIQALFCIKGKRHFNWLHISSSSPARR